MTARKMIAVDSSASYGEGWPPTVGAAIQVKNLWKKYGGTEAVRGISFHVNKGEIFGLHDGPYADTTEQLGGYFVINVANLDHALEWAEKCPAAASGAVEVRPLMQDC